MKKVGIISLVIVIAVSLMPGAVPIAAAADGHSPDNAGSMTFTLAAPGYQITKDETGLDMPLFEDYSKPDLRRFLQWRQQFLAIYSYWRYLI